MLYEGGIRVPGTVVWPSGIDKPRRTDIPCVTSDFYPTVLDALDLEMAGQPRPIDGVSLMPLLRGDMEERPEPIAFEHSDTSQALVDDEFKLVRPDQSADFELYNLRTDPSESDDVIDGHPDVASRMRQTLEEWHDSCDSSRRGDDYGTC